jgi:glycosyltransferase involved in cell wall biosynthesis
MESLSTGCAVVASNTPPVQEVITAGQEGILVDFFDPEGLAARVDELLADPAKRKSLGDKARQTIIKRGYDLKTCLNQQLNIVYELMA